MWVSWTLGFLTGAIYAVTGVFTIALRDHGYGYAARSWVGASVFRLAVLYLFWLIVTPLVWGQSAIDADRDEHEQL